MAINTPKKELWSRLWVAVDGFLALRTLKSGMVPADAPEITELIRAHDACAGCVHVLDRPSSARSAACPKAPGKRSRRFQAPEQQGV